MAVFYPAAHRRAPAIAPCAWQGYREAPWTGAPRVQSAPGIWSCRPPPAPYPPSLISPPMYYQAPCLKRRQEPSRAFDPLPICVLAPHHRLWHVLPAQVEPGRLSSGVERVIGNDEADGSIPSGGTTNPLETKDFFACRRFENGQHIAGTYRVSPLLSGEKVGKMFSPRSRSVLQLANTFPVAAVKGPRQSAPFRDFRNSQFPREFRHTTPDNFWGVGV